MWATGKAGLLERTPNGGLRIHDWWDYAGRLVLRRRQDAERKRAGRRADDDSVRGRPADIRDESSVNPTPNRTLTLPYQGEGVTPASPAWTAFVKARGINLTASDSEFVREMETLYGADAVAEAVVYCDKHKRDNFLRIAYIQTILSSWQADGSLGLHPDGADNRKGNGHHGTRTTTQRAATKQPPVDTHDNQAALRRVLGLGPDDPIPDD